MYGRQTTFALLVSFSFPVPPILGITEGIPLKIILSNIKGECFGYYCIKWNRSLRWIHPLRPLSSLSKVFEKEIEVSPDQLLLWRKTLLMPPSDAYTFLCSNTNILLLSFHSSPNPTDLNLYHDLTFVDWHCMTATCFGSLPSHESICLQRVNAASSGKHGCPGNVKSTTWSWKSLGLYECSETLKMR